MKEAAPGDVNFITRSFFVCLDPIKKTPQAVSSLPMRQQLQQQLVQLRRMMMAALLSSNIKMLEEGASLRRRRHRRRGISFFLLCRGNAATTATTAAAQLWQQLLLWKAPLRANQLPLVGAEESDWNAAQRRNAADVSRPFQLGRCWLFVDFERVAARGVLNRKKPLFIFWNLCFKFSLILKEKYFAPKDRFRTKSCLKNEL